jgi:hypothetical protein
MDKFNCPYSITCDHLSKAKNELEKKLDAEKARHRSVILEMENVIVDLMVENYRYESRVKALERLLEEYEKNQPIIKTTWGMTDTHEEAKP